MSSSSQIDTDKAQVLSAVDDFHQYFSVPPPFTNGSSITLPNGIIIVPLPPEMGGLKIESFNEMYERVSGFLASRYESGMKSFSHQLAEPKEEIWVSGNIAAVFVGWSATIDGNGLAHSTNICTLHRLANDSTTGNPWRLSGLVNMTNRQIDNPIPPVETGPLSEIIAPYEAFIAHIKARDWDAIPSLLLPGSGATVSKGPEAPDTLMWPEYTQRLRNEIESGAVVEKKLLNCEGRRCGDLAFVWAPFVLHLASDENMHGVTVCSFRLEGERWLIAGLQESTWRFRD
ncbi:hypothetical protein F53441_5409 [Fusarium austroafricanum]|uniref:Uncharacterized protein n=1 Tax=Fusarium austroafricanum TaxID=2364996 RepID=A0A8H4KKE1_9HYPO|nr:hypothetical protein F53441_5409 [Fusarium austroafricanum]